MSIAAAFAGLALARAALLAASGAPTFSPEDYVYTALAGDHSTFLPFLLDWHQPNYRPLGHVLVHFLFHPIFAAYGQAAYVWLVAALQALVLLAFPATLTRLGAPLPARIAGVLLFASSPAWTILPFWNALALNILLFQLAACAFLCSLAGGRAAGAWLAGATFVGAGSYTFGGLFPPAYLVHRRLATGTWEWRRFLLALPLSFPAWAAVLHIVLGSRVPQSSPTFALSPHPLELEADVHAITRNLASFLELFSADAFPLRAGYLGAPVLLLALLLLLRSPRVRAGAHGAIPTSFALALACTLPAAALGSPYVPRYAWPGGLFLCASLALAFGAAYEALPYRAAWYPTVAAWIGALWIFTPGYAAPTQAGFQHIRSETQRVGRGLATVPSPCLPVPARDAQLPDVRWLDPTRRSFLRESMIGLAFHRMRLGPEGLSAVLDPRTFQPRCTWPTSPLDSPASTAKR